MTAEPIESNAETVERPNPHNPAPGAGIESWIARWRQRPFAWTSSILAAVVIGYLLVSRLGASHDPAVTAAPIAARMAVPVTAARARRGDLNRYLTAIGSVTAFNTVTIKSRVDGQIVKVAFTEGQFVHQGDLLIEIDPRPYQAQLAQAEGALARDRASLMNAQQTLERDQSLYRQNVIAKQDLDNQASSVGQFQGAIVSDQANIDAAKLQLVYSRITAPIGGRIGLRLVDVGNVVHATDSQGLAVITQIQPIAVLFSIPEDDLPRVTSNLKSGAQLPVEAYDRDLKTKLAVGSLLTIDNQIDQSTGTVRLKAVFPNDDNALFPNQFVNARLLIDTRRNAVLIPSPAIQRHAGTSSVYVVKPDNTVDLRTVTVDASQGDLAAIASGIQPGEMVVTDGVDKLQPGSRVSIQLAQSDTAQGPRE